MTGKYKKLLLRFAHLLCCVFSLAGVFIPQSSKEPLQILGAGFKGEPVLNFDPPIWAPDNFTVTVVSETELKLELAAGSLWSKYGGALMVKGINVGDGEVIRRNNTVSSLPTCSCK